MRRNNKLMNEGIGGSNANPNADANNTTSSILLDDDIIINTDNDASVNNSNTDAKLDENGKPIVTDVKTETTEPNLNTDITTEITTTENTNDTDQLQVIDIIRQKIGVDIVDENNNSIIYEDSEEGIAKYTQDVIEVKAVEVANEYIQKEYELYPELARVHNYLRTHNGSLEGYSDRPNYNNITLSSEDAQFNIIVEFEKTLGNKDIDDAKIIAESFKKSGKLEEAANKYLGKLKEHQTSIEANEAETLRQQEEARLKEQDLFYSNLSDKIIKEGKLFNYELPLEMKVTRDNKQVIFKREDIYKYITQPVTKEGYSQYQIDRANANKQNGIDGLVYDAIMLLTNNNPETIIKRQVAIEKTNNLKDRISKTGNSNNHNKKNNTDPLNSVVL